MAAWGRRACPRGRSKRGAARLTGGLVLAGLVPATYAVPPRNEKRLELSVYSADRLSGRGVDARDKRGQDGAGRA